MQEKIDYNDLVNSIQEEEALCAGMDKITVNDTERDTASKEGKIYSLQLTELNRYIMSHSKVEYGNLGRVDLRLLYPSS